MTTKWIRRIVEIVVGVLLALRVVESALIAAALVIQVALLFQQSEVLNYDFSHINSLTFFVLIVPCLDASVDANLRPLPREVC